MLGFVVALREVLPDDLGFPVELLKDLGSHVPEIDLPEQSVALLHEVARQTLTPLPLSIGLVAPPGVRDRIVTSWTATGKESEEKLTPAQTEALRVLEEGELLDTKAKPQPRGSRSTLNALERRGLAQRTLKVTTKDSSRRLTGLLHLTNDTESIEKFLSGPGLKRPAQLLTIMRLQGSEVAALTVQEIKALGGVSDSTIKALVEQGLLEMVSDDEKQFFDPPTPNALQERAIDAIGKAVKDKETKRFLLYGITGSGKTEVYLRTAAEALKWGRQVLYLVPEIALTAQVVAQLRSRFGKSVAMMHSNMTPAERLENWMAVRRGDAPVVLGARSALFAPFTNLGLVIMDEEHEASYKQENAPRYHAKRLATFIADRFGAPIVMGSATPSVETFYEAEQGRVERLDLPERAADARLPEVFVEDMTDNYKEQRASMFSLHLSELLKETIQDKKQAILFLNRRAYSPFIVCRDCGHRFLCDRCAVSLALHRRDRKLRCHHCGYQEDPPDTCPECQSTKVRGFGVGTERVEEAMREEIEGVRVARLDRDTTRRKGALEEVFAKFRGREIDVLVGTQMVAKGLDFPNVTLVGVIAADISLNVPDFRAGERTFQLLSQVAGRAGRGQSPGRVVIQTFSPDHPSVVTAQSHDYETLYRATIKERKEARYPPFVRLVNVLVIGDDHDEVVRIAEEAAERIRSSVKNSEVLGPVACPLEKLKNLWRRHILVKLRPNGDPEPIKEAVHDLDSPRTRVTIDVDPYNMA
ncbi:MAG: primosomal protein N' [Armatimonadetes bacterium]|nr:primosomal protein N' [Armatimonadota bacterium]